MTTKLGKLLLLLLVPSLGYALGNTTSQSLYGSNKNGSGLFNYNSTGTITVPNATDTLVDLAGTQTLTGKTLTGNTMASLVDVSNLFSIEDSGDSTKVIAFNASGNTTGKTLTISAQQALSETLSVPILTGADTIAVLALAQTLTNKTISTTSNTISGPTAHSVLLGEGASAISSIVGAAGTLFQGNGSSADPTAVPTPTLGVAGTTAGSLTFGSTGASYTTTVQPAPSPSPNVTFQLPSSNGASGYVLSTNGSGVTSWISAGGTGTVTSVAETVPAGLSVSGSPITTTGTLALTWSGAIPAAQVAATRKVSHQIIASSGTYTPNTNMLYVVVEILGGGGGAGGCTGSGTNSAFTAGGGAGGHSVAVYSASTIGASQTVTIGSGGSGGTAGTTNTGGGGGETCFGGTSSCGGTPLMTANGGSGGTGAANTTGSAVFSGPVGGGSASGGDINAAGAPGEGAWEFGTGQGCAGSGGSTLYGAGGTGICLNGGGNNTGNNASGYGAGGGGATCKGSGEGGGNGVGGVAFITEFDSQ